MISFYITKCKCHSSDLERQRQTERLGADCGQPVDSALPGRPLDPSPLQSEQLRLHWETLGNHTPKFKHVSASRMEVKAEDFPKETGAKSHTPLSRGEPPPWASVSGGEVRVTLFIPREMTCEWRSQNSRSSWT